MASRVEPSYLAKTYAVYLTNEVLPKSDFWTSEVLAEAFKVTRVTIQRAAKKHNIGTIRKTSRGSTGLRIFLPEDLPKLCQVIHPRD